MNSVVSVTLKVVGDVGRTINTQLKSVNPGIADLNRKFSRLGSDINKAFSGVNKQAASFGKGFNNAIKATSKSFDKFAKDAAKSIAKLERNVAKSLGKLAKSAGSAFNGIGSAAANLMTNAFKVGIVQVIGMALAGAAQLNAAMESQEKQLSIANTIKNTSSASMGDAIKQAKEVSVAIAKMANSLPGANSDYTNAFVNNFGVLSGVKGLTGQEAKDNALKLSKGDVLQRMATPGVSDTQILDLNTKFITEAQNVSDLQSIEAGKKSGAFLAKLEEQITKSGKTLADMGAVERIKLLSVAKEQYYGSAEFVTALTDTLGGQLEGIKGTLFDATTGVFGFNRDIAMGGGEQTTVLDEFATQLKRITTAISGVGMDLGDPLKLLVTGIRMAGTWIVGLVDSFKNIMGGEGSFGTKLGRLVGDLFSKLAIAFYSVDWAKLISGFAQFAVDFIIGLFGSISSDTVGALGKGIASMFTGILQGIWNICWTPIDSLARGLVDKFLSDNAQFFGAMSAGFTLIKQGWSKFTTDLANWWNSVVAKLPVMQSVATTVTSVASTAAQANPVGAAVGAAVDAAKKLVPTASAEPKPKLGPPAPNAAGGFDPFGIFAAITRERYAAPGTSPVIANNSELILNRQQQAKLVGALQGSSVNNNTFYINGAMDPSAVAAEVERVLNKLTYQLESQYMY